MTNKIPNTPFATRLSGSAKETQLRIRSMFQWKKKRPPVWLFAFIVVVIFGCIGLVSCREKEDVLCMGLNARVVEIDTEQMILYIQDIDEDAAVFGQRCALDCKQAAEEKKLIFVDYETSELTDIPFAEFQVGDELVISMLTSQKEGAKDASALAEQVQLGTQRPLYVTFTQVANWYSDFIENCWSGGSGYQYTGFTEFTEDDRTLTVQDVPENLAEELLFSDYYFRTVFEFDGLLELQGSDSLRIGAENERENAAEGMYFEKVTIHNFATMTEEDFTPGGAYFADAERSFKFVDTANFMKDAYGLTEYAVIYLDLSWKWSEKALSMGPQLDDGRYERIYLVGKTSEDDNWRIYECFWGEQVLERTLPEKTVEFLPEGKPLIVDYFQQWYDRVYFLGEEPGVPQEGDLRIDSVRYLGSEPTYETTGEAYAVEKSYYSARREQGTGEVVSKWRAEGEEYIVMGRSMDGDLYEVRGKRLALREDIARTIFEVSYNVSDWEVTLWHDKNLDPWPLALGRWSDEPLSLVDGEPTIERLDGWEPIYKDGDYWNRCTLDGLSIRRYYNSSEDYHGNYNIELTRDDFATLRGIRLGSTRDEVKAVYPELKSGDYWTLYPSEDYLWYCEDELDFGPALIFFFENDKVSKIVLNNMFN